MRAALDAAGRDMTTLHVREDALRDAVAQLLLGARACRSRATSRTRLRIRVLEHTPVAVLVSGDREIAASGDGLLLKGVVADGDLPVIRMDGAPAGDRVRNTNTKTALTLAATAPDAIRRRIDRLWTGPKGMMLALVDGPDLIFGDASDARRQVAGGDPRPGRSELRRSDLPGRPDPGAGGGWRPRPGARADPGRDGHSDPRSTGRSHPRAQPSTVG